MGDPAADRGLHREQDRAVILRHAVPGLVAIALVVAVALAGGAKARGLTVDSIMRLGTALNDTKSPLFEQKNQGSELQRAAFERPDLLVAYGSSELLDAGELYYARRLFGDQEVGFDLFPVAKEGTPILSTLQKVSAVGEGMRGKKVVISVSPGLFLDPMASPSYYAGSYSALQAGDLIFSSDIGLGVRRAAARRMLDYPQTLSDDPFLRIALGCLAEDTLPAQACLAALTPMGRLRNEALRLQDAWRVQALIGNAVQSSPPVPRRDGEPDWDSLMRRAENEYREKSDSNPFGFWDTYWMAKGTDLLALAYSSSDEQFRQRLNASKTWGDLDLLLQALRDLGAEPLVISSPIHGPYYTFLGVSRTARATYYERLRAMTHANGATLVDFAQYEDDRTFATDQWGHLSPKGWVAYAKVLDDFHRGVLR